ncbi:unnamed protein product [Arctia plantaginis]|uniref:Uncharacterized protein n=1 Tax=Arctia plantaginis TaxID=874455 RepID=A0A8S0Z886_ARCPL|nr:unnamed protein product [Arctia plantaginis]CAB3236122.1 unnamed protein product [Arctia plantaginis]
MVKSARSSCVPFVVDRRCADMLLHDSKAVRGAVQRRRSGPCGVPCCPGAGPGAPQAAQNLCLHLAATRSRHIQVARKLSVNATLKACWSRAPPPWLEDDTP